MVTVVGEVPQVFRCEGERAHDGDSMLFPGRSPSVVYRLTRPPTICARPGRAEYNMPSMTPTWPGSISSGPFQITMLGPPDLTHTYFHQIGLTLMALLVAIAGGSLAGFTVPDRRQHSPEPAPASERPLEA